MNNIENLSTFEKDIVLQFLLHHMSFETRKKLMAFLPNTYNKLVGMNVMTVSMRTKDYKNEG